MKAHDISSQFSVLSKSASRLRTFLSPRHRNCCSNQVYQRKRQQEFPAERHQLVVAEARQRATHPDIDKKEYKNLGSEPKHRQQGLQDFWPAHWAVPAAQ